MNISFSFTHNVNNQEKIEQPVSYKVCTTFYGVITNKNNLEISVIILRRIRRASI